MLQRTYGMTLIQPALSFVVVFTRCVTRPLYRRGTAIMIVDTAKEWITDGDHGGIVAARWHDQRHEREIQGAVPTRVISAEVEALLMTTFA
jgi:hypothetical protein